MHYKHYSEKGIRSLPQTSEGVHATELAKALPWGALSLCVVHAGLQGTLGSSS